MSEPMAPESERAKMITCVHRTLRGVQYPDQPWTYSCQDCGAPFAPASLIKTSGEIWESTDSWRERRVQELENLLAKRSGCSHCNDSASGSTSEESSTESREDLFKRVLVAIEGLTGDDACEELSMSYANRKFVGDKKLMYEKLMTIYELAHAFNPDYSCYHAHENWRKQLERFNGAEPESPTATDSENKEKVADD